VIKIDSSRQIFELSLVSVMFSLDAAYPRPLSIGMIEGHFIRLQVEDFNIGSNIAKPE
jgi:hypothetical protein